MHPINDFPIRFSNSVHNDRETIDLPVDSHAIWDLIRFVKSRAGVFMSDLVGPIYVRGGQLSISGPSEVFVDVAEGWPALISDLDRCCVRVVAPSTKVSLTQKTLIALTPSGLGAFDITPPSPPSRRYLALDKGVIGAVPLWAIMADPVAGVRQEFVHDLRINPMGWVFNVVRPHYDGPDDRITRAVGRDFFASGANDNRSYYHPVPNLRLWVAAEEGSMIDVHAYADGVSKLAGKDMGAAFELTVIINGELADGGNMDAAGVSVLNGPTISNNPRFVDISNAAGNSLEVHAGFQVFPGMLHTTFRSEVFAIHDIRLGVKADSEAIDDEIGIRCLSVQLRARVRPPVPAPIQE